MKVYQIKSEECKEKLFFSHNNLNVIFICTFILQEISNSTVTLHVLRRRIGKGSPAVGMFLAAAMQQCEWLKT